MIKKIQRYIQVLKLGTQLGFERLWQLGTSGRESYTNENDFRTRGHIPVIEPDEKGRFALKKLSFADLEIRSVSSLLHTLVETSPSMSFAVNTYEEFANKGYDLISEDEEAIAIIENFIARIETGDIPFRTRINEFIRSAFVEGAVAAEIYTGQDGEEFIGLGYISPFSLAAEQRESEDHGKYYVYGQWITREEFKVLQDKENPNPTFIYAPSNKRGDKPFGNSLISASIFSTFSLPDLLSL